MKTGSNKEGAAGETTLVAGGSDFCFIFIVYNIKQVDGINKTTKGKTRSSIIQSR